MILYKKRITKALIRLMTGDGSRLGGGEGIRGSRKERIRTEQVTDKERSTNVRVTDVLRTQRICTV